VTTPVWVLTETVLALHEQLLAKLAAGREKDLADVKALEAARGG
jgi:hypothetical protein